MDEVKGWGTIAIGVRCGHSPDPFFSNCYTALVRDGVRKTDVVMDMVIGLPHHYAAEDVIARFLKTQADSLLFVDDDMIFGKMDLELLRKDVRGYKFDMLGACYPSKIHPHYPLVMEHDPSAASGVRANANPEPNAVLPVAVVGLGFTLIRRTILQAIIAKKPQNEFVVMWGPTGDSEDTMLCRRVEAAGGKVGVSTAVQLGHRMTITLRWTPGVGTQVLTRKRELET